MSEADRLALLLANARLQTLRAGLVELMCVAAFGRSLIVDTQAGLVELRTWRGRSYLWRGLWPETRDYLRQ